jgi:arylsulfatase
MGYDAMREQTLARQKEMGIVPADTELPPVNPIGTPGERTGPDGLPFPAVDYTKPWDSLSADERRLFGRMAEVYAGFLCHADHQIGRLLDYLEESGQRDNTLMIVVSDNGASGEGGPDGSVNENLLFNGIPDDLQRNLAMIDELGGPKTYNHYCTGWAMAFNTPFKMWKRYEFNGGTSDPCILAWPSVIGHGGEIRHQYHHAIDIVPTVLDLLDVTPPDTIKGFTQSRFDGVSMRYSFDDPSAPSARKTQFFSMLGSRGIWHEGWKAVTTHPTISGWSHFNDDIWELYHTDTDRAEVHDLAAEHPDKLREMVNLWFAEAGANDAFPLDDRTPLEVLNTPRPQLASPRNRYIYYPDVADVPEHQAANIHNRSYTIGAQVDIPAPGAQGVIFAHGSWFGGHALYVKGGRLHYVNNFVGIDEQKVVATEDLPTGEDLILSASFDKDGEDPPASPPARCPSTTATARSARGASRSNPAISSSPVRGCASAATAARRSPAITRANGPTGSPAASSSGSRSTSAASPTSTWNARRPRCSPGSSEGASPLGRLGHELREPGRAGEPGHRLGRRHPAAAWGVRVPVCGDQEVRGRRRRARGRAHHLLRVPQHLPAAAARGGDPVPGAGREPGPAAAADRRDGAGGPAVHG